MKFTFNNDERLRSIFEFALSHGSGAMLIQDEKAGVFVIADKAQRDENGKKIRKYAKGFCASVSEDWTKKVDSDDFMIPIPIRIVSAVAGRLKILGSLAGESVLDITKNARSTTFKTRKAA